ncbi:MAG TPA: aminofutalosine synthase MqnE [Deltaproteobacteria bacterium]|nr:MAG: aminofutalosine synthase MqnE [Deltaproteobacteria bacterium GWA2_45_12]HBF13370.1 aminofutalosine synthase MqnE [Deltaproteobacteria bacterium]
MSSIISQVKKNILEGKRLTEAEALSLYSVDNIFELGRLANVVRENIHQDKTYYIVNRHIDYSNVCAIKCKFCAFAKKKGEEGSFEFSIDEIVRRAKEGLVRGITEVHIVGGFHPTHPWEFYTGLMRALKKETPSIHVKAFTAAEIRYFSKKFRKTERQVFEELLRAGLDSMPGGGAEIFDEEVRKEICGPKGSAEHWITTHKLAHSLGLKTNATMLYGHVEQLKHRIDHMRRIRQLQDETEGFLSFIPLAFNPKDTEYEAKGYTSAIDDLKTLAIARLYMDNVRHIKAYWVMSGVDTAQMAQSFGADDFHGTVIDENITHMAGATSPEDLPEANIIKLIREAGRRPVQRDSLYREIII